MPCSTATVWAVQQPVPLRGGRLQCCCIVRPRPRFLVAAKGRQLAKRRAHHHDAPGGRAAPTYWPFRRAAFVARLKQHSLAAHKWRRGNGLLVLSVMSPKAS